MAARVVQLEGERIVATRRLPRKGFRIGRDPDADWPLHGERISRQHARLERVAGGWVLVDLGTPNGTTLNGRPVRGRAALSDGDLFTLAGEATLRFEVDAVRPGRAGALAALAVATALATLAVLQLARDDAPDPAWGAAARLALSAVTASREGDPATAKAHFKSAVGVLYKAGTLDDVERQRVLEVGLERIGARLSPPLDLVVLYRRAESELDRAPDGDEPPCRLEGAEAHHLEPCLRLAIPWVFARLHQTADDVPDAFVAQVGRTLRAEHGFLERSLARGRPLVPMLAEELEAVKMPPLLHYVALIESGYRTGAESHAGAVGLWQFMPGTARDYGLAVEPGRDDRLDAARSTRAAARYLQHLVFEFGSDALLLALAGYNYGQERVRSALKKLEDPFNDRSYWRLVERGLLPEETALYVARFTAAALAGETGLPGEDVLEAAGF